MLDFPGYNHFAAQPMDDYRVKWAAAQLAIATTGPSSLPNISLPVTLETLASFNAGVNQAVHYRADPLGTDTWQAPALTWLSKLGDCEDYAIVKYAALLVAGVSELNIALHIGEIKRLGMGNLNGNRPHAWLAVCIGNVWYAVDQIFDHLIPAASYINWKPDATCTGLNVWRYGPAFTLADKMRESGHG
jgi:hypothetical protein